MKKDLNLNVRADGEFWMSYEDWSKYFNVVEICNSTPDALTEEQAKNGKLTWEIIRFDGEWKGPTGGNREYMSTYPNNPQYVVELTDPDDNCDDGLCTIVIQLMKKDPPTKYKYLSIGFKLYSVTDEDLKNRPMSRAFFEKTKPAQKAHESMKSQVCIIGYLALLIFNEIFS